MKKMNQLLLLIGLSLFSFGASLDAKCCKKRKKCCPIVRVVGPQGPQGDPGSAGLPGPAFNNYVFAYTGATQTVPATAFTGIAFEVNPLLVAWTKPSASEFTATVTGIYQIDYFVELIRDIAGDNTVATVIVLLDGAEVAGSDVSVLFGSAGEAAEISKNIILNVSAGQTVQLAFQVSDEAGSIVVRPVAGSNAAVPTGASISIERVN